MIERFVIRFKTNVIGREYKVSGVNWSLEADEIILRSRRSSFK